MNLRNVILAGGLLISLGLSACTSGNDDVSPAQSVSPSAVRTKTWRNASCWPWRQVKMPAVIGVADNRLGSTLLPRKSTRLSTFASTTTMNPSASCDVCSKYGTGNKALGLV